MHRELKIGPKPVRLFLYLIGAPGSGKSTLGGDLAEHLGINFFSTGAALRRIGENAGDGKLLPDRIINELVISSIEDAEAGYVVDGYPRSLGQAQFLEQEGLLSLPGFHLCLWLGVKEDIAVARLLNRARLDDSDFVIRERLKVFRNETFPIARNTRLPILYVHADGSPADTFDEARVKLALSAPFRAFMAEKEGKYA